MALWTLILLFVLIKLPLVAFMLWLPFRGERNIHEPAFSEAPEDDGGIKTLPGGSGDRHPPRRPLHHGPFPRRGPHGSASPTSPERVRSPLVRVKHASNC
jgi:hypothetical protein